MQKKLEQLKIIQQDCERLLNFNEVTPEAKEFLAKQGYININELNEKLNKRKNVLIEIRSQDVEYRFTKIDAVKVTNMLSYLELVAKKLSIISKIKFEVGLTKDNVETYIKRYMEFLENRAQRFLNNIHLHLEGKGQGSTVFEDCQLLSNRLQEIRELQTDYERLFSLFENKNILEDFSKSLDDFALDLYLAMQGYQAAHDTGNLDKKLVMAKALSQLDNFCTFRSAGQSFIAMYRQYQPELFIGAGQTVTDGMKAIEEHNYSQLSVLMGNLESAGTQPARLALDQLKQILIRSLSNYAEETKMEAIILGEEIKEDWPNLMLNLKTKLERIKAALMYVSKYLLPPVDLNANSDDKNMDNAYSQTISFVTNQLSSRIIKAMDSVSASIKNSNYYEANQKMMSISRAKAVLGTYLSPEAIKKVDGFSEELAKALEAQKTEYANMEIGAYSYKPPKDQYDRFEQVKDNVQCRETWERIEATIRDKFRQELKKIKEGGRSSPDLRANSIRKFELAVKSLPVYLQNALSAELEDIKNDLKKEENDLKTNIEGALAGEDISQIQIISEQLVNKEGANSKLVRTLQLSVADKAKAIKNEIDNSLKQEEVENVLIFAQHLFRYKDLANSIVSVKEILGQVMQSIRKFFNKTADVLSKFSSEENVEVLKKSYENLMLFNKFIAEQQLLPEGSILWKNVFSTIDVPAKTTEIKQGIVKHIAHINKQYAHSLEEQDLTGLKQMLDRIKRLDHFCRAYRDDLGASWRPYETIVADLIKMLTDLYVKITEANLINDQTKDFEKSRKKFYDGLVKSFNIIKQVERLREHLGNQVSSAEKLETELMQSFKSKAEVMYKEALSIIKKPRLIAADSKQFNYCFQNLHALKMALVNPLLITDIDDYLKDLDGEITLSLNSIYENLYTNLSNPDMEILVAGFVKLKSIGEMFPHRAQGINAQIDDCVAGFKNNRAINNARKLLPKLAALLTEEVTGIGATVVSENSTLKYAIQNPGNEVRRNTHNIDYVLNKLRSPNVDIDVNQLRNNYNRFEERYLSLKKLYLRPNLDTNIQEVANEIKAKVAALKFRHSNKEIVWNSSLQDLLPELMAYIFVLWTLKNATHYFDIINAGETENDKDSFLYVPHPAQVVSILRIFGIGYQVPEVSLKGEMPTPSLVSTVTGTVKAGYKKYVVGETDEMRLFNNMVQIGTGEGKSITLAVTAIIFALYGIEVSCACYSDYLSRRDYADFASMFSDLGVAEYIRYGTFDKLCEDIVNKDGDVRDAVKQLVTKDEWPVRVESSKKRPQLLLVDEVDVFFNKDFYGELYSISASLRNELITNLVNYIWQKKLILTSLAQIQTAPAYKACRAHYGKWSFLLDEAIKDMIAALKTYQSHQYIVKDDKIAYKDQDGISFKIAYGYNTVFAYCHEHEQGNISQQSRDDYTNISLLCGSFSYAVLPYRFMNIMGVTGTLEHLNSPEKAVMHKSYGVNRETYMPSVYGDNKRKFAPNGDIKIENISDYFVRICEEITARIEGITVGTKRTVLVFFENREKLLTFRNSEQIKVIQDPINILTEEANEEEKKRLIKQASRSGQVTLLTRSFGRGTDFISYSPWVNQNGGVHVIQTFLSEEKSEEIQIMGRTARQGQEGSYSMVLQESDLEKYLITLEDIKSMRSDGVYHERLDKKRNDFFATQYAENSRFIEVALIKHKQSDDFVHALYGGNVEEVKRFLGERNRGAMLEVVHSKTICLMDGTGSMGHLLQKSKNTVGTMFERAAETLKTKNMNPDAFQLQFAVYRDYDCMENLLVVSPWETKPENLRNFMDKIGPEGGGDYEEAIEIGLWHANDEHDKINISQVILIGDAPAKTREQIAEYRSVYGGESYWRKSRFKESTFYEDEAKKLAAKKVPVHAFFVAKGAEANFRKIAEMTKGQCEELDVNDEKTGAERLTDLVTVEILRNVGQASGQSEELVEEYRKKYGKTHT